MGWLDTIADYAVPDVLVDAAKAVRDADWLGVEGAKRNKAYFKRKREADARRDKVNRSREGGLSVYRPATATNALYDLVGKGTTGLHRAFGASERDAAQAGHRLQDTVESAGSILGDTIGWGDPVELEKSAGRIAEGSSNYQDKVNIALMAAGPVGKAVGRGAKAVGRGIKAVAPETVGRVGSAVDKALDWALPTGPLRDADHIIHGGNEIYYPGEGPSLSVRNAPEAPAGPRVTSVVPYRDALPPPPAPAARPRLSAPPIAPALRYAGPELVGGELPPGPFKPKGGNWFPNVSLPKFATAEDAGWTIRDRGPHTNELNRWEARRGEDGPASFFSNDWAAQNWADSQTRRDKFNWSPEGMADQMLDDGLPPDAPPSIFDWLQPMVAKYIKNEAGTTKDPIRALADDGIHWDRDMTPRKWDDVVRSSFSVDPRGTYSVPTHGLPAGDIGYDEHWQPQALAAAPWLRKAGDQTEPVYSMRKQIPMGPLLDIVPEMVDPYTDLPSHLQVDPDLIKSGKLTFGEVARRAGEAIKIRADEAAEDARTTIDHPAVKVHKLYNPVEGEVPEGRNPFDAAWVEFHHPTLSVDQMQPKDRRWFEEYEAEHGVPYDPRAVEDAGKIAGEEELRKALKTEGRRLNICVGQDKQGYCEKIMDGSGRIFSLRDAHGNPRVTLETSDRPSSWNQFGSDAIPGESEIGDIWNDFRFGADGPPAPVKMAERRPMQVFPAAQPLPPGEDYLNGDLNAEIDNLQWEPDDVAVPPAAPNPALPFGDPNWLQNAAQEADLWEQHPWMGDVAADWEAAQAPRRQPPPLPAGLNDWVPEPDPLAVVPRGRSFSPVSEGKRKEAEFPDFLKTNHPEIYARHEDIFQPSQIIKQIKGWNNERPGDPWEAQIRKEKGLPAYPDFDPQPYISDFVKSGKWGNVLDLDHTNLTALPTGTSGKRFIDKDAFERVIADNGLDDRYQSYDFNARQFPRDPQFMDNEAWDQFGHHFDGYAKGGRVEAPIPSLRVRDPYEQGLAVADTLRTVLPPERERAYQDWRVKLPKNLQYEGDYDLRGAYLANAKEAANGHMDDEFKLPNHRTFSTGSRYASAVNPAGRWVDNVFWADPANFRYQSGDEFADYINREEVPHGNFAVLPSDFDLRRR